MLVYCLKLFTCSYLQSLITTTTTTNKELQHFYVVCKVEYVMPRVSGISFQMENVNMISLCLLWVFFSLAS